MSHPSFKNSFGDAFYDNSVPGFTHSLKYISCWQSKAEPGYILYDIGSLFPELEFVEILEYGSGDSAENAIEEFIRDRRPKFVVGHKWQRKTDGPWSYRYHSTMDPIAQAQFIEKMDRSRELLGYTVYRFKR
jgi:hypothetical protein